jgi:hypothetical protein
VQRLQVPGAFDLVDQVEDGRVLEVDPLSDDPVDAGGRAGDRRGEQRAAWSRTAASSALMTADGGTACAPRQFI